MGRLINYVVHTKIQRMIKDTPTADKIKEKPICVGYEILISKARIKYVNKWKCGKCGGDLLMNFICCPYCQAIINWGDGYMRRVEGQCDED